MPEQEKSEDFKKYIESTLARARLAKTIAKFQVAAIVICFGSLAFAVWLKFSGGRSDAIMVIAGFGSCMGFLTYALGKFIEKTQARLGEIKRAFDEADRRKSASAMPVVSTVRIPLTIGFANLIGESMTSTVNDDVHAISGLFQRSIAPPPHQIPRAEVLFVYAKLGEDGTITPEGKSGIRQIVQMTNSAIVIVAAANSADSIQKAMELPGPKTANLVFTFDRNGQEFAKFFHALFQKMCGGKEMLAAWVELAPQIPGGGSTGGPQTLLVAEGGKIAFPSAAGSQAFAEGGRP
ncbi:hypothetical protein HNQ51_002030 [Inhella inkyongensis]|uniref:Uncharacterized protein n=1 Tax=Inhella inkyongensis TaxID=392593 RepID=A0A840S6U6_9BURK|nr:hypothetical protein [Inhella inkyongensis]MBB5204716.1 hypothetical protein [Inhella inkyongensis]